MCGPVQCFNPNYPQDGTRLTPRATLAVKITFIAVMLLSAAVMIVMLFLATTDLIKTPGVFYFTTTQPFVIFPIAIGIIHQLNKKDVLTEPKTPPKSPEDSGSDGEGTPRPSRKKTEAPKKPKAPKKPEVPLLDFDN